MRSGHDILEELDISRRLDPRHSHSSSNRGNTRTIVMVRGARAFFIVVASAVLCLPGTSSLQTRINKLVYNYNGIDMYSFEFETSDGTYRREDGGLMSRDGGLVVRGEYGFIDPTGRHHSVRYVADQNGFQPEMHHDLDTRFNDRRIV